MHAVFLVIWVHAHKIKRYEPNLTDFMLLVQYEVSFFLLKVCSESKEGPYGFVHPKPKCMHQQKKIKDTDPEPKSAVAASKMPSNWRQDLPEAFKHTIRGLQLPMPRGHRTLNLFFAKK